MIERKKPRLAYASAPPLHPSPILDDGDRDGGGGGGGDEGDDRLTALPDTLRLYILSLLPLKSAIRASSLSTQWRGIWRYRWPQPSDIHLAPSSSASSPADFIASVDSTLLGRGMDRRIDALTISLPPGRRYDEELHRWIARAAVCGVVDLSVRFFPPVPPLSRGRSKRARRKELAAAASTIEFQSIRNCRDLVHLAISGIRIERPRSFGFASLEVLRLHDSPIASSTLKKLINSCPRLRLLELKRCRKLRGISINKTHRFASLTIVEGPGVSVVSVCTLGVRSFSLNSKFRPSNRLTDADELKDVHMSTGCREDLLQGNMVSNLGQLSDVKFLSLCDFSLQIVASAIEIGVIRRLTELQLIMEMMTERNLSDIYRFFRLCDCYELKKLFVKLPDSIQDPLQQKYLPAAGEEAPQIDFRNLTTIKVSNFKGHKNEMKLLEFLLRNAGSLERLQVVSPQGLRSVSKASLGIQLSRLKRASQDATVILKEYDDLEFLPIHSLNWQIKVSERSLT